MDGAAELVESILQMTGWTQTRLVYELRAVARSLHEADPTGLQPVTVNRWRRGRQKPGPYYTRLLRILHWAICGELAGENDTPPSAAGAFPSSSATEDREEMKRRRFFAYAAVLAGSLALDPERLTAALRTGIGIDADLVDDLDASLAGHARRWHVDRPEALLPLVKQDLEAVNELRIGSHTAALRRRLTSLTSATAALAGWLTWQAGNHDAADAYYMLAYSLAKEIWDSDDRAFVLVLRSFMSSRLFGAAATEDGRSLTMLQEAVVLTDRSASPYLRAFALRRRAEETARSGGAEVAAERDLDDAQTILAAAGGPHEGFHNYCDEDRTVGTRGTCAMLEGRPRDAIALLSSVLSATPPELAAERSILVADLGAAHAMVGDVDEACLLLGRSLELGGSGYTNRVDRVRSLRRAHLSSWSDSRPVERLDEQLHAMYRALSGPSTGPRSM